MGLNVLPKLFSNFWLKQDPPASACQVAKKVGILPYLADYAVYQGTVLIAFPVAVIKYTDKSNSREKGFNFGSQFEVSVIKAG